MNSFSYKSKSDFTFDTFNITDRNQEAVSSMQLIASELPGAVCKLVYLFGPSGSGKSHLLHAAAKRFLNRRKSNLLYMDHKRFIEWPDHTIRLYGIDVIIIDDWDTAIQMQQITGDLRDLLKSALVRDGQIFIGGRTHHQNLSMDDQLLHILQDALVLTTNRTADSSSASSQQMEAEEALFRSIMAHKEQINEILDTAGRIMSYEDGIYRYYHQSFKVFNRLPALTSQMVKLFTHIFPNPLNEEYIRLINKGTHKRFTMAANNRWQHEARPIVSAAMQSRMILHAMERCAQLEQVPKESDDWKMILQLVHISGEKQYL